MKKKLYIIPVPYYNISRFKNKQKKQMQKVCTNERKIKKAQEIEKSKGQGIGD